MKIRTGFVSNSSSSSFIIGLAATENGEHIFNINDIRASDYSTNGECILTQNDEEIEIEFIGDGKYKLSYESFTGDRVSCIVRDGNRFTFLNGTGPDGDSFFYDGIDDLDYGKILLNDFEYDDIVKYKEIQRLGGDVSFGAGRDG